MEEDRQLNKYLFSSQEQVPETTTELLYVGMLPNLSSYAIGLLKVLLAAIPSSKAKNDSALILSDVLSRSTDANDMLSNSLNLEVSSAANMLEEAVLLAVDINRHKEIIVKACTAIIINLLKFFRLSHVYQFENFAQQLVLSNCLPLLLKFLDQNMVRYLQSKNEIAPLNYPRAPIHYVEHDNTWPKLNADNVEEGAADSHDYFMWRNVFSSVNLLRILNKLTKNKQSRTMMLVVFKSAPILKRCLKVRLVSGKVVLLVCRLCAGHFPSLHAEAAQDAGPLPGPTVETQQHGDHLGRLHEGPAPTQRRLGLRQRDPLQVLGLPDGGTRAEDQHREVQLPPLLAHLPRPGAL